MNQVQGFIKGEMSGEGLGTTSDGSKLLTGLNMNGKRSGSNINWSADSKTFNRSWKEVQRDLTPNALDPSTIGKNLMGLSYPGGDNPRKYNGQYDYTYAPKSLAEYPAIGHDRRYDNLNIAGVSGLLIDTRAIAADWEFVKQELLIASLPIDSKTRAQATVLGIGLGLASLGKTLFLRPPTYPGVPDYNVLTWYIISSHGVTNSPSK